jgi:putative salt-induced outer membrane protein YdiY
MKSLRTASLLLLCLAAARTAAAQALPPPLWDVQVGAAFVGTSGNSETSTIGGTFSSNRRGLVWKLESTANAVRTSSLDVTTAERYNGLFRAQRALTTRFGFTSGVKLERDEFAGLDFRSVLDAGLSWVLARKPLWTLDGITALAWNHESRVVGDTIDHPVGVLQLLSQIPLGAGGGTTQRFTFFPDFSDSKFYQSEAEITAQASMTDLLALKFAYLLKFVNSPPPGFEKTDNTATASVVLRLKSAVAAPTP